jgi:hypothetical protein
MRNGDGDSKFADIRNFDLLKLRIAVGAKEGSSGSIEENYKKSYT